MFFAEVTLLMREGERLRKRDRAPAQRVTVTILESDRDTNNSNRNLTQASLYVGYGTAQKASREILIDPVILPYNGPGFLWSGIEPHAVTIDGEMRIFEHRQVWHVLPVEKRPGE